MFETSRDAGSTPATSTILVSESACDRFLPSGRQSTLIYRYDRTSHRMILFCFLLRQPETGSVKTGSDDSRKDFGHQYMPG